MSLYGRIVLSQYILYLSIYIYYLFINLFSLQENFKSVFFASDIINKDEEAETLILRKIKIYNFFIYENLTEYIVVKIRARKRRKTPGNTIADSRG